MSFFLLFYEIRHTVLIVFYSFFNSFLKIGLLDKTQTLTDQIFNFLRILFNTYVFLFLLLIFGIRVKFKLYKYFSKNISPQSPIVFFVRAKISKIVSNKTITVLIKI